MNKLPIVLEYIWLALSLFCIGLGIDRTIRSGIKLGGPFFILALLALAMYLWRRYRRLKSSE